VSGPGSEMITPFVPRPSRFPHFLSSWVSGNATRHPMNGQWVRWLSLEIHHKPLFFNQFLTRSGRHLNCHSFGGVVFSIRYPKGFSARSAHEEDGMDSGNPFDMAKL
jgi:hypothetical protein